MKVQKQYTALRKMSKEDTPFVDGSPAERVSMIWDLTAEAWSLIDPQGVERRLQRDVAKLIRPRNIIQNKRTTGRKKDELDVEYLQGPSPTQEEKKQD